MYEEERGKLGGHGMMDDGSVLHLCVLPLHAGSPSVPGVRGVNYSCVSSGRKKRAADIVSELPESIGRTEGWGGGYICIVLHV